MISLNFLYAIIFMLYILGKLIKSTCNKKNNKEAAEVSAKPEPLNRQEQPAEANPPPSDQQSPSNDKVKQEVEGCAVGGSGIREGVEMQRAPRRSRDSDEDWVMKEKGGEGDGIQRVYMKRGGRTGKAGEKGKGLGGEGQGSGRDRADEDEKVEKRPTGIGGPRIVNKESLFEKIKENRLKPAEGEREHAFDSMADYKIKYFDPKQGKKADAEASKARKESLRREGSPLEEWQGSW
jgi:hypothetical protein